MQHPPLQTIVSMPRTVAQSRAIAASPQARASWNAQAFCAGVACQLSHCRQKVAKSSASSRQGSVTGWLTPGQLAASASSRQAASPS